VSALLAGDDAPRKRYAALVPILKEMEALADVLRQRREKRGSIELDIPEADITVDADGWPVDVRKAERGAANKMIEEFMLLANETVARHMHSLGLPILYRVHEVPDEEKLRQLGAFVATFGLALPKTLKPKAVRGMLSKADEKDLPIISRVLLRALKKARYCEQNLGHFGLATEHYCHFTSPIRRYPDLVVHRAVKDMLNGRMDPSRQKSLRARLPGLAESTSASERTAMEAERDIDGLKKCEYMSGHLGEKYDGVVAMVTGFGMFVELPNTCEGLVRIEEMRDDVYAYDEVGYRLIGRRTGKVYRLGDEVRVKVAHVNTATRRIEFNLVEDESGWRSRRSRP